MNLSSAGHKKVAFTLCILNPYNPQGLYNGGVLKPHQRYNITQLFGSRETERKSNNKQTMTEFAKHISECSEQASKIPEEKEADHQNHSVEEEEEEYPEEAPEKRTVTEVMGTNKRIQRYLIAVEYIGTRFSGSQKQLNCRTVVGVLEVFCYLSLVG